jgi:hypothetical protein
MGLTSVVGKSRNCQFQVWVGISYNCHSESLLAGLPHFGNGLTSWLAHSMSHSRAKPHGVGHCQWRPWAIAAKALTPPPPSPDFVQAPPPPFFKKSRTSSILRTQITRPSCFNCNIVCLVDCGHATASATSHSVLLQG